MDAKKKKFVFFDFVIKHQKAIVLSSLIISAVYVLYALIFATPFYGLLPYSAGIYYCEGAEIYMNIQPFNKALLNYAIMQFGFIILLFVYFTQKRRIFYITNYVVVGLYACFASFLSVYNLINILKFRKEYNAVDFEKVLYWSERNKNPYKRSTFTIDFGIILCVVTFIVVALIVSLAVAKFVQRKKELKNKQASSTVQNSEEATQNA